MITPTTQSPTKTAANAKSKSTAARRASLKPTPVALADCIKIGLDVGLRKYVFCRQVDGSLQEPPRTKSPQEFRGWILEQKRQARKVVVCYEAGFLGFELARWLQSQSIECWVMAPIGLDERHRRVETDSTNARDIGSRLDRYLAGNPRSMTVCRIPTREEELHRHQTRQRDQLLQERNRLTAQGRSLLWQFNYLSEAEGSWWKPLTWEAIHSQIEAPIRAGLERLRAILLEIEKQLAQLEKVLRQECEQRLPEGLRQLPVGIGWLSALILTHEIMDWGRFKNRRQVGCLAGLVPSEASTGETVRRGPVTKVGNPRVRHVLVEMAWRLVRYQPDCHALGPWRRLSAETGRAKASAPKRKKAIVAVARRLAVDLWRLATQQTTAAKLGFRMA